MAWKVYCLECEWSFDLRDNSSVRDLLGVLTRNDGLRIIHRDVASADDLVWYLNRWSDARYRGFRIGYLAPYGYPGRVVFRRAKVLLEEIAEQAHGSCDGKIVYFGSCSVGADRKQVQRFKKLTGAHAVCGYANEADWTPSAAFDLCCCIPWLGMKASQRRSGGFGNMPEALTITSGSSRCRPSDSAATSSRSPQMCGRLCERENAGLPRPCPRSPAQSSIAYRLADGSPVAVP